MSPVLKKTKLGDHLEINSLIVETVMQHYGIEPISSMDREGWVTAFCPTHENVNTPAFRINLDSGVNVCYSICGKRSLLHLVKDLEGIEGSEASSWERAKEVLHGIVSGLDLESRQYKIADLSNTSLSYPVLQLLPQIEQEFGKLMDQVLGQARQITRLDLGIIEALQYTQICLLDELAGDINMVSSGISHMINTKEVRDPITLQSFVLRHYTDFKHRIKGINRLFPTI